MSRCRRSSQRPEPLTDRVVGTLLLALTLVTIAPVPAGRVAPPDVAHARGAVRWLPVVGLALGSAAGGAAVALHRAGPLVGATVAVVLLAVLTRGLHLDGLADVADGLGSRRPPAEARAVMKRGDVGPFGVATLVLVLLLDVACTAAVLGRLTDPQAVLVLAAAVTASRGAVVLAAGAELPSAGPGLGALVAGTQAGWSRLGLGVVAANALLGLLDDAVGLPARSVVAAHAAVTAGPVAAYLLARHCARRFDGTTGDVFGAVTEVALATSLLVLAAAL